MYSEQAPKQQQFQLRSIIERNPEEWITGTEPMTSEQKKYLKSLSLEQVKILMVIYRKLPQIAV